MGKLNDQIFKEFYNLSLNDLQKIFIENVYRNQLNELDTYLLVNSRASEVADLFLLHDKVNGGLLGSKGGITPKYQHWPAIDLLVASFRLYVNICNRDAFVDKLVHNMGGDLENQKLIKNILSNIENSFVSEPSTSYYINDQWAYSGHFSKKLLYPVFTDIKEEMQSPKLNFFLDIKEKYGKQLWVVCSALWLIIMRAMINELKVEFNSEDW